MAEQQSNEGAQGTTGTQGAQGQPAPASGATQGQPAPASAVDVSQIPDEALKDRLDRARRQALKDAGFASPEEAKAAREKLAQVEAAEKAAREAAMSEQEKLAKSLEAERLERERLARELEAEREHAKLLQVAHARGIKNLDYAAFLVSKAKKDGEAVDVDKVLGEAMGDALSRTALGVPEAEKANATPPQAKPANTSPHDAGTTPKPTSGPAPSKTAKDMSREEWAAYKKSVGIL